MGYTAFTTHSRADTAVHAMTTEFNEDNPAEYVVTAVWALSLLGLSGWD